MTTARDRTPAARSRRALRRAAMALVLGAAAGVAHAETSYEFWPELDAYLSLNSRARLFLLSTATRVDQEGRRGFPLDSAVDGTLGVHLDYSITPTLRKSLLEQDWERNRYLWVRVGYQHARNLGDGGVAAEFRENRGVFELNVRTPPVGGWALEWYSRLRADLRERDGERSNLYRARLGVERPFEVRGHRTVPYVTAETIYDTRYDTWKQQRYQLGVEVTWTQHWRIEPYLEAREDRRSEPARVYALGLAFKYFH